MTRSTLQPSLTAGAARPGLDGSCVALALTFGSSHAKPGARERFIAPIAANQAWMQVWTIDAKPAYPVAHTDRPTQRPLERSP
jgi:hypothetical protein